MIKYFAASGYNQDMIALFKVLDIYHQEMIKYFAAHRDNKDMAILHEVVESSKKNILYSYYYFKGENTASYKTMMDTFNETNLFLDSGAFSAWNSGVEINIEEYMRYIEKHNIKTYAVLDAIGDANKTKDNQLIMESNGFNPIPVFHMGENIDNLFYYLDRYQYMALGGMVHSANLENWLTGVWREIHKRSPLLKVHGFGLTTPDLLIKYPWYSIDSGSWYAGVKFAEVYSYNKRGRMFTKTPAHVWLKNKGYNYHEGDVINNEIRFLIIQESVKAFSAMIDDINRIAAKIDYTHLSAQMNIFEQESSAVPLNAVKSQGNALDGQITGEGSPNKSKPQLKLF